MRKHIKPSYPNTLEISARNRSILIKSSSSHSSASAHQSGVENVTIWWHRWTFHIRYISITIFRNFTSSNHWSQWRHTTVSRNDHPRFRHAWHLKFSQANAAPAWRDWQHLRTYFHQLPSSHISCGSVNNHQVYPHHQPHHYSFT